MTCVRVHMYFPVRRELKQLPRLNRLSQIRQEVHMYFPVRRELKLIF